MSARAKRCYYGSIGVALILIAVQVALFGWLAVPFTYGVACCVGIAIAAGDNR